MNKSSFIFILLIAVLFGASFFLLLQNRKLSSATIDQASSTREISNLPSASPNSGPSPSPQTLTVQQVQTLIMQDVNTKNYQSLAAFMNNPAVSVTLRSSECCGELSPKDAIVQMAYLNDSAPYDFNQNSEKVQKIKSVEPPLKDAFIGVSQTGEKAVAFKFNDKNLISSIELAASWKLY